MASVARGADVTVTASESSPPRAAAASPFRTPTPSTSTCPCLRPPSRSETAAPSPGLGATPVPTRLARSASGSASATPSVASPSPAPTFVPWYALETRTTGVAIYTNQDRRALPVVLVNCSTAAVRGGPFIAPNLTVTWPPLYDDAACATACGEAPPSEALLLVDRATVSLTTNTSADASYEGDTLRIAPDPAPACATPGTPGFNVTGGDTSCGPCPPLEVTIDPPRPEYGATAHIVLEGPAPAGVYQACLRRVFLVAATVGTGSRRFLFSAKRAGDPPTGIVTAVDVAAVEVAAVPPAGCQTAATLPTPSRAAVTPAPTARGGQRRLLWDEPRGMLGRRR